MTLRSFIDDVGPPTQTIAVVSEDATGSGPLEEMLAETFAEQPITIETDATLDADADVPPEVADALATDGDTVVLLEDDEPVAASPMLDLYDSLLAINSDLFVTGARGVGEIEFPDVLAGLEGTRLRLRGYPLAHKEKLLLILVSRYIEQRAWEAGNGTLHSGFQRLSRLDDEVGTYETYDALAETDLDVNIYGADGSVTTDLAVTEHTGTGEAYRDGWFVVFEPDARTPLDTEGCALVCLETEPRIWDGFWTTDPERVTRLEEYIAQKL